MVAALGTAAAVAAVAFAVTEAVVVAVGTAMTLDASAAVLGSGQQQWWLRLWWLQLRLAAVAFPQLWLWPRLRQKLRQWLCLCQEPWPCHGRSSSRPGCDGSHSTGLSFCCGACLQWLLWWPPRPTLWQPTWAFAALVSAFAAVAVALAAADAAAVGAAWRKLWAAAGATATPALTAARAVGAAAGGAVAPITPAACGGQRQQGL